MMNKPILIWKKWVCPLGKMDNDDEFEDDITLDPNESKNNLIEIVQEELGVNNYPKAILTTCGLIPIKSYNNPATAFNWWVLHTGFPLTQEMVSGLIEWGGVEIFDQVSNYRIRFAIALALDEEEVKAEINEFLTYMWKKTYAVYKTN